MLNKVIHLNGVFKKDGILPTASDNIESIFIEGYANACVTDRSGDIITQDAWNKGLENYLKNPIVLAHHEHDEPIGRVVDHRVDSRGLWVKARISAAAEDTFNLIKDGILTTFSVGFMIKDAMYDAVTDLFVIKELELLEISVVAIPCNQDSTFNLSKSFGSEQEAKEFRKNFISSQASAKKQDNREETISTNKKGIFNMDPKELEALLAKTASDAAAAVIKAQAEAADKLKAEVDAQASMDAKVEKAVAARIEMGQSGAEKLLADIEKRFSDATDSSKKVLEGLESSLKEKASELEALQKSKMSFSDKESKEATTYEEREQAVLLAKFHKKDIKDTKFGARLVEKAGAHTNSATWETEVSLNLENEIRRRLVVAPILRNVNMKTNVMKIPVNPDAGIGTWMQNTAFGTTESAGAAATHALNEITLSAYKVATLEYINFEEEEDSLIVLTPIIREAMVRRLQRAIDRAALRGAGSGTDPLKGLAIYDATSVVVPTNTGVATMANMRALRKDMGVWGLDPAELFYIVSTDVYYDLLEDTSFQSVLQVGQQNATLLTGQVGVIGQTPVLVSSEFTSKAGGAATASTNIGAICVAPGNFIVGNQRGMRFDTQDVVTEQRTALVASMRIGMQQLSTSSGMAVSTLRWS